MPTTLTAALQALAANPSVLAPLAAHLNSSSSIQLSVTDLLTQAQLNPALAPQIAAQITGMTGVPAGVLPYVEEMAVLAPAVATDASAKVQFAAAVAQAKAVLVTTTSPAMLGSILTNLGI